MRMHQVCLLIWSIVTVAGCTRLAPETAPATAPTYGQSPTPTDTSVLASPVVTNAAPDWRRHDISDGRGEYSIPSVDGVVAAVLAADGTRIKQLIHYATFGCTQRAGLGGPPVCRAGESAGTAVAGLPLLDSEGVVASA